LDPVRWSVVREKKNYLQGIKEPKMRFIAFDFSKRLLKSTEWGKNGGVGSAETLLDSGGDRGKRRKKRNGRKGLPGTQKGSCARGEERPAGPISRVSLSL